MILCPICNNNNHHLSVTCSSCGSYIQTTIDNLDLFSTAWDVIENPKKTFHKIAIAKHKNYGIALSAIAGIAIVFFIFWIIKAAEYTSSLLNFLLAGFVMGPVTGIFSVLIFSLLLIVIIKLSRERIVFRNAFAVVAYALVPVNISVIIILPIEIMTFGLFFFSSNPPPYQLKPVLYYLLLSLDCIFVIWSLLLIWIGVKKLTNRGWLYSTVVFVLALSVYVGIVVGVIQFLFSNIN
jgi:hypothetical protein